MAPAGHARWTPQGAATTTGPCPLAGIGAATGRCHHGQLLSLAGASIPWCRPSWNDPYRPCRWRKGFRSGIVSDGPVPGFSPRRQSVVQHPPLFSTMSHDLSTIEGAVMPNSRFSCPSRVHGPAIAVRRYASAGLLLLFGTVLVGQSDPAMPPEAERQLARAIYKEMIEIKSGYTTGATTPVARSRGAPAQGGRLSRRRHLRRRRESRPRPISWFATAAPARGSRSCCSRTPTSSKPSAKTGAWIRSRSPRRTATSTAAAPATTRRRPRSGSRTSFATSAKASSPIATSSSRSPPTRRAAARTTASTWLLKNKRD